MMWPIFLCFIGIVAGTPTPEPKYDVIVVGMGAAGTMASTTLARAGRRVLTLEASDRIGGRVYTVPFGDNIVEVGAEWIHGVEKSRTYELAMQNNITIIPQKSDDTKVFRSNGSEADTALIYELAIYGLKSLDDPPEKPEPIGKYIKRRLNEYIGKKYPQLLNDTDFLDNFYVLMDQISNNIDASNSWNDVTTASEFEDLEGHQEMSWHTYGYRTLFEILMNTYNGGSGLPSLTVKLNSEVTHIKWPQNNTSPVEVTTKDGTVYAAKHVIVTLSLGVLKERYSTLFNPPLPQNKTRAIDFVSFGVVGKVIFRFPHRWCTSEYYLFIWKNEDVEKLPENDKWIHQCEGISVPMSCKNCTTFWFNGDRAKLMETLPEEELKTKMMSLIRKFVRNITIPEPLEMIRSKWYSNPLIRGSYSYDNVETPQFPNARSALAAPLTDASGTARVLFAGEATNSKHFSTVHGALETGEREAARVLAQANK